MTNLVHSILLAGGASPLCILAKGSVRLCLAPVTRPAGPAPKGQEVWTFVEGNFGADLCPEGGDRTQPRVSTLGNLKINEFALKGREGDQIILLLLPCKNESAQLRLATIRSYFRVAIGSICRPFRARRSGWRFPGLKPGLSPLAPSGHALRAVSPTLNTDKPPPFALL
jgi:hypothetical protein